MKCCRRNRRIVKCITTCAGDTFCIAIDIFHQATAAKERIVTDAGHTVGDDDGGQAAAIPEGIVADACHTATDGNGGQAATFPEGMVADAGHAIGDNSVHTTCNLGICCCFYNCIAVIARIILFIII